MNEIADWVFWLCVFFIGMWMTLLYVHNKPRFGSPPKVTSTEIKIRQFCIWIGIAFGIVALPLEINYRLIPYIKSL